MIFLRLALFAAIAIPIVGYIAYTIFFYNVQRQALFPAQGRPVEISDPSQIDGLIAARFETPLGQNAGFAWYLEPPSASHPAPVVIIGHGNGEIADDWVQDAQRLRDRGYAIIILGYPGYGHAVGTPSKDSIVTAALGAYDWVIERPEVNKEQIVLFGHSVGGAATLAIAEQRPTQGAILLSAFASIDHIARDRYLPSFLAKDRFDNIAIIKNYDQPVYLMHGTEDVVVFPYQADLLHAAASNSQLEWLPCGHGGCIQDMDQFWNKLDLIMQGMLNESS